MKGLVAAFDTGRHPRPLRAGDPFLERCSYLQTIVVCFVQFLKLNAARTVKEWVPALLECEDDEAPGGLVSLSNSADPMMVYDMTQVD